MVDSVVPIEPANAFRQEIQFLWDCARRLREMADTHQTALSDQLRVMAAELDGLADRTEKNMR